MYRTVNKWDFVSAFKTSESRREQFTHEALFALFEYYEELEADTGEPIEFDIVAICCEWDEVTTKQLIDYYGFGVEREEGELDGAYLESLVEWLRDRTTVIELSDTYLVQIF